MVVRWCRSEAARDGTQVTSPVKLVHDTRPQLSQPVVEVGEEGRVPRSAAEQTMPLKRPESIGHAFVVENAASSSKSPAFHDVNRKSSGRGVRKNDRGIIIAHAGSRCRRHFGIRRTKAIRSPVPCQRFSRVDAIISSVHAFNHSIHASPAIRNKHGGRRKAAGALSFSGASSELVDSARLSRRISKRASFSCQPSSIQTRSVHQLTTNAPVDELCVREL